MHDRAHGSAAPAASQPPLGAGLSRFPPFTATEIDQFQPPPGVSPSSPDPYFILLSSGLDQGDSSHQLGNPLLLPAPYKTFSGADAPAPVIFTTTQSNAPVIFSGASTHGPLIISGALSHSQSQGSVIDAYRPGTRSGPFPRTLAALPLGVGSSASHKTGAINATGSGCDDPRPGMWRVVCGGGQLCSRWGGDTTQPTLVSPATLHHTKMLSPGPYAQREPVRLPFLDATPSNVLHRIKHGMQTVRIQCTNFFWCVYFIVTYC